MRTALGISAGSEVVGSVLLTTTPNGVQTTEYRVISADDEANTDLGELVASSIELMTTQISNETVKPDGIAVAYRSKEQTQSIRTAVGTQRRDLQLVPESTAALTYLRSTGEVAQFDTVAVFDLGATGLTVTVLDQIDGTVLESRRTAEVSGSALDELVYGYLLDHYSGDQIDRPSRGTLLRRGRAAKEHLSTSDAVTIDHIHGRPLDLQRDEFDGLVAGQRAAATAFAAETIAASPRHPGIVAVIGGGGNIPAFHTSLVDALDIPVLAMDEPEAVIARGAALVADSAGPLAFPVVSMGADAPIGTFTKVAGALIGAFVVVGLIIGYGVQALSPATDDTGNVSPAGTTTPEKTEQLITASSTTAAPVPTETGASFPTYEPPGVPTYDTPTRRVEVTQDPTSTTESTTSSSPTTTTSRTPAPTLRPAPDLPLIPWPEIQRILPRPNPPAPESVTDTETPTTQPPSTQPESSTPPDEPEVQHTPEQAPVGPMRPDTGSSGQ